MIRKLRVPASFVAAKISEYLEDPRTRYATEPLGVINRALGLLEKGYMQPRELNDATILATAIQHNAVLATLRPKTKAQSQTTRRTHKALEPVQRGKHA